jgi:hypothetical protein
MAGLMQNCVRLYCQNYDSMKRAIFQAGTCVKFGPTCTLVTAYVRLFASFATVYPLLDIYFSILLPVTCPVFERFEVFTAVTMKNAVFCDITPVALL